MAGTWYTMTNDGAGAATQLAYGITGYTNVWNTSTNRFDFSGLELGDTFQIALDLEVTTGGADTVVDVEVQFGIGSGLEFSVPTVCSKVVKTAGATRLVSHLNYFVGNTTVRNYPAQVRVKADATGSTVKVLGWYVVAVKDG